MLPLELSPHVMPQNKFKEAYLVPALKARVYRKVLVAKCLPGCVEGPYQGQPLSPRKCFKNVLGTKLEGTFERKARLENADKFHDSFGREKRRTFSFLRRAPDTLKFIETRYESNFVCSTKVLS